MVVYWLMFLFPTFALFSRARLHPAQQWIPWLLVAMFYIAVMGFRYNIGGDWPQYLGMLKLMANSSFSVAISRGDPGYFVLNWVVGQSGGGIYWVNAICALILVIPTVQFCRRLPFPWLGLLAAVPYMLIVVGMGYTRQAVALGFAILGLIALSDRKLVTFVLCIVMAALFHKTAVVLIPLAVLVESKNRLWTVLWVGVVAILAFSGLMADNADSMWKNYVDAQMESQGALIRVLMDVMPAVIFLVFRDRWKISNSERVLWIWISLFSIACLPALAFTSTAVDRMALYLLPIQMYVFGRIPALAVTTYARTRLVTAIVAYYAAVQWVWLNLGVHATGWVPYKTVLW